LLVRPSVRLVIAPLSLLSRLVLPGVSPQVEHRGDGSQDRRARGGALTPGVAVRDTAHVIHVADLPTILLLM
jgi:hypothetical protein